MRVVVAGGTGVVGTPLVRMLRDAGHEVIGIARRPQAGAALENAGATSVSVDLLSPTASSAMAAAEPEVIVHVATALGGSLLNPYAAFRSFRQTNKLRTTGTAAVVDAAEQCGARVIAASTAFAYPPGEETRTESDPLWTQGPGLAGSVNRALAELEARTLATSGTVLRFGSFYGPGTYYAPDGAFIEMLRRRVLPIIGDGQGLYTFVHVDDAARAVVAALDGPAGTFNIADDAPMTAKEWMTHACERLGAKPPRRLPRWAAARGPGALLTYMIADQPPVSAARAHAQLGWHAREPRWPVYFDRAVAAGP